MTSELDGGPVSIVSPPQGSAGPATVALDSNCNVAGSATTDANIVFQVVSLSWSINGVTGNVGTTGASPGSSLPFSAGPAYADITNTISVTLKYNDMSGNLKTASSAPRLFNATATGSSCLSISSGRTALAGSACNSAPIAVPLPRFYKLAIFGGSSSDQGSADSLLFGGLLQRSAVYLEYDVGLSTPAIAVWKDINLPDSVGKWTLRVGRKAGRLVGELTLFRLTQTEVSPPSVFGTSDWNVRGDNVLRSTGQPGSFVDFASRHNLIVVVCPA